MSSDNITKHKNTIKFWAILPGFDVYEFLDNIKQQSQKIEPKETNLNIQPIGVLSESKFKFCEEWDNNFLFGGPGMKIIDDMGHKYTIREFISRFLDIM